MNDHTLTVLEYRETLSRLALYTQSEPGRDLSLAVFPHSDRDSVVRECDITAQALLLLEDKPPDLGGVSDTTDILGHLAAAGAVLDPMELLALLQNQIAVRYAKAAVRDREGDMPALCALVDAMIGFPDWERWVEKSISPKGEVLDAASPDLAKVRKELRSSRNAATAKLEEFIRGRSVAKVIQEQYVTLRNGRFVVPAKPEYHRTFEGVVQDTSQSGQTVFVEPLFAVGLNNSFTIARAREEEEIRRALARMSDDAAVYRHEMAGNMTALAEMDLVLAKARFGVKLGGLIPGLDDEETMLTEARHPHLVLEPGVQCVPIEIRIGGDSPTLVITGPNTGGKTVALKTLGLLTMMVQSGIPVPVSEESRFRVFSRVFADIGDEQSLSQSLSTFSGHMKVIAQLLDVSDSATLALLDELGAGTDPQEGSALSIALLEALHEKGACVAVTTHHNLLKEFAYRAPFASNASTVFDGRTLEPTYRLRLGAPGRSHALEVAQGLGLNADVITRAREVMGSGAVQVDELLGRLTEEVDRESMARERAEEIARMLEAERQDLDNRKKEQTEKVQELRNTTRREARALLRDIERKGRNLLKRMKDEGGGMNKPLLTNSIREIEKDVVEKFPPPPPRIGHGPITAGGEVQILSLGVIGSVTELLAGGREAEIVSGGIRMRVPTRDLAPVDIEEAKGKDRSWAGSVSYEGTGEAPSEINLIGTTVEEALESLDKALDHSLLGDNHSLRVVHGKGTGALKRAISKTLKDDPRVSTFGPAPLNQGGAGVTIVELKD
jgi:DNA mismatch repair protein MutS2